MKDVVQFLHEVKVEFSKVVWPKTNEFVGSTIVVLFLVTIFAIYFGIVDGVLSRVMSYIFKAFGL